MDDLFEIIIDKNNGVGLSQVEQLGNTVVVGSKRFDVYDKCYIQFIYEAIRSRNTATTFFVSSRNESYRIYSLAKESKRRVALFSPSLIPYQDEFKAGVPDKILGFIDYSRYILNNYIIIIDIEYLRDEKLSNVFTEFIIRKIEIAMMNVDVTSAKKHNIYINDAHLYTKKMSRLMYYGREYNTSLFFFVRSCSCLAGDGSDMLSIVSGCRNRIVLDVASMEDRAFLGLDSLAIKDASTAVLIRNFGSISEDVVISVNDEQINSYLKITDKKVKNIRKSLNSKIAKYESSYLIDASCDIKCLDGPALEIAENLKNTNYGSDDSEIFMEFEEDKDMGNQVIVPKELTIDHGVDEIPESKNSDIKLKQADIFGYQKGREELDIDFIYDDEYDE